MNRLNCRASLSSSLLVCLLLRHHRSGCWFGFLANLPLTIWMSKRQQQRRRRRLQCLSSINLPSLAHSSIWTAVCSQKSGALFPPLLLLEPSTVLSVGCRHLSMWTVPVPLLLLLLQWQQYSHTHIRYPSDGNTGAHFTAAEPSMVECTHLLPLLFK